MRLSHLVSAALVSGAMWFGIAYAMVPAAPDVVTVDESDRRPVDVAPDQRMDVRMHRDAQAPDRCDRMGGQFDTRRAVCTSVDH